MSDELIQYFLLPGIFELCVCVSQLSPRLCRVHMLWQLEATVGFNAIPFGTHPGVEPDFFT